MKQITIEISEQELDDMEDYLTAEMDETETEQKRKTVLEVWRRMVTEIDKK